MGKSQIKSNHDVNQMTTVPDSSLCVKCHQCTSGLTVNVSAKIRDGTITKINSLTQLQQKNKQSNHYSLAQITESCDLFKSPNQIT